MRLTIKVKLAATFTLLVVMSAVGMKPTFGFSDMARPRRRVCVTNDRS